MYNEKKERRDEYEAVCNVIRAFAESISFGYFMAVWLMSAVVLMLLNYLTVNSRILEFLIKSTWGVFLFLVPVCPQNLVFRYGRENCRLFIRVLAVMMIGLYGIAFFSV